ncbi:TAFII55 protein conserved region-domain-containing protein [Scheffersomyces coipomensis]|uniref:TAFII55 protein conserved region-domain-containing protein n=1 Tax=Scheffersomyces coipomensis TaxID=1788519 RepID=UPI00315D34F9
MAIKLKIKVPSSSSNGESSKQTSAPLPKLKIKPLSGSPPQKKLKISLKKPDSSSSSSSNVTEEKPRAVPRVRIKPTRIPGEGYDSEAPDLEDDPLIEQGIIVRFLNDVNLDFVHNAVDTGDLTGVNIKWITREKAVVNVNGTLYSARLIDLPTITELYKTVDKKNIFKTFDICQILLVLHKVIPSELNVEKDFEIPEEVLFKHPLYSLSKQAEIKQNKLVLKDGLIDPFEKVHRRFKPRKAPHRVVDDIDLRVNELIRLDDEAEESHFELVDPKKTVQRYGTGTPSAAATPAATKSSVEPEEFDMEADEPDLEEELQRALDEEGEFELADAEGDAAEVEIEGELDAADEIQEEGEIEDEEEEDEEEEDDDDDDDEEEEDEDEDSKADKQHVKLLEEEIADLEKVVEYNRRNLATANSKMLKMKFQNTYTSLKASLDQKKRDLGKILEEQDQLQKKSDPNHVLNQSKGADEDDEEEDEEQEDEDEEGEEDEEDEEGNNEDNINDIDDLF